MAQDTFGQVWNRVRLYAPDAPVGIIQEEVRNAHKRCLNEHNWSELRTDASLLLATAYSTGTAVFTNASTTVTGVGTTWTSAMIGRQIAPAVLAPWYTITAVGAVDSLTIDRSFAGATSAPAGISYSIGNFYVDFPTDLDTLEELRDRDNNWRLRTQVTQGYLDKVDPERTSTGTPVVYAAAPPRLNAQNVYIPRFELWPRVTAERELVYRYYRSHDLTLDSTRLIEAVQPEVVLYGALAGLCLWPGTASKPNPLHNLDLHARYTQMMEGALQDSVLADLERSQTMIQDEGSTYQMSARYIQEHGLA